MPVTQPPTRLLNPAKPVSPCCQAGPEHEIAAAFRGFEQSLEYARAACLIINAGLVGTRHYAVDRLIRAKKQEYDGINSSGELRNDASIAGR